MVEATGQYDDVVSEGKKLGIDMPSLIGFEGSIATFMEKL
jgi:hypothetical protein